MGVEKVMAEAGLLTRERKTGRDERPLITDEGELKCCLYKENGPPTYVEQCLVTLWKSGHVEARKEPDDSAVFITIHEVSRAALELEQPVSDYESNIGLLLLLIMETFQSLGPIEHGGYLTSEGRITLLELLETGFSPTDEELLWAAHDMALTGGLSDNELRQLFERWRNRRHTTTIQAA